MSCTQYENKPEYLNELINQLLKNELEISSANVNLIACLLCKNFDKEIIPSVLSYFEKAVANDSYISANWYALAKINQIVANNLRAEEAYQKAINLDPLNMDYLVSIAKHYMNTNNWQKSLDYCNKFVGQAPEKRQLANEIMLSVFYRCGMYKDAIQNFELGIDLNNLQAVYKAMHSYILLDKPDKVISLFEKIDLSDNNESYAIMDLTGQAHITLKTYDKALETYLKLANTDYNKYRNDLATIYSNLNDFEHAIPIFKEILSENPNDTNALVNYALSILKIDIQVNFDEAVKCYQKALTLDSQNYTAHSMLGMLYYGLDDYQSAYHHYFMMSQINPTEEWTFRKANTCLLHLIFSQIDVVVNAKLGITLIDTLSNKSKLIANDYILLGIFYRALNLPTEAIAASLRSLELEPTNSYCLYSVAKTFYFAKDYPHAISYFEKSLIIDSTNLECFSEYINCLLDSKDLMKALEVAKRAVDISESSRTIHQLAIIYRELKEYSKAKPLFLKALNLEADNTNFEQEIKLNLLFCYIMANCSHELLELMNKSEHQTTFNDLLSKSMKVILNLKIGNYQEANKIIPLLSAGFFPENSDLMFKAFASFNLKKENWSKDCIKWLKDIDLSDMQYFAYKEDLAHCLGMAHREENDPAEALKYFEIASETGKRNAANWYNLGIEQLYLGDMDSAFQSIQKASECENSNEIKSLKYFNDEFEKHDIQSEIKLDLMLAFFEMLKLVYRIKEILIYNEPSPVYHYTKLSILKELLKENSKLRLNNAAHMNDPSEGTAILEILCEATSIFDIPDAMMPPNVFLTSFCCNGDELPLWVQYAADGIGCSLELDYKLFDTVDYDFYENAYRVKLKKENSSEPFSFSPTKKISNQFQDIGDLIQNISVGDTQNLPYNANATMELITQINDHSNLPTLLEFLKNLFVNNIGDISMNPYCLYRVAYINIAQGAVISLDKKSNLQINENLTALNKIISETNQYLQKAQADKIILDAFNGIVKEVLSEIQYLFKTDSYMHEKEIRLIKRVSIDDPIVKEFSLGDNLPTLYIEMDRKLHFSKCILGPKVTHPTRLTPVLYKSGNIAKVELSKIKYR